jgi:RHS repeat-associated protein
MVRLGRGRADGRVQDEYNGTAWTTQYMYAGSELTAEYTNNTTEFVHKDHLGSTRLVTAVNKSVLAALDYLPFGRQTAGASPTTHKFTGKERDSESGLDNFGARYDASSLGRFMTPDQRRLTIRDLINAQKWNKYAYTINNFLRYFDPNGMEEMEVQLRAYIQAKSVSDPAGRTFAGDNRGATSAQNVTSRTSITVRIETDPSIRPGNPIISQTSSAGTTKRVDANGNVVNSATATQGLPTATGSRDANGILC